MNVRQYWSTTGACLALLATASPAAAVTFQKLDDPFFKYDRPASYETVSTAGVHVPLRDGSYLACTLVQPATAGQPAPGRFPGVVIDYTAYHVLRLAADGPTAASYASHGYNVVYCDPRGSGDSPGALDPFGPQEQLDNYDLIEWFAAQPWSDGNIGQEGGSYGAHTSLLVAVAQPPHLRAIIPLSGISDWYGNTIYHGGIESATIWSWELLTAGALEQGGTNSAVGAVTLLNNTFATYRQHPLYDWFWRQRSVSDRWDRLTIPTLEEDGWNDRYKDGMIANFRARPQNLWLVLGPWGHASTTGATPDGSIGAQANLAWWDHWLKGMDGAPLPRQRVTTLEMPESGGSGWHQYRAWPPPGARRLRLFFNSDNGLATTPGEPAKQSYTDNGRDSGCDPSSASACDANQATYDKSPWRLTYTTPPLGSEVVLSGSTEAVVRAAFPSNDGNVVVRLSDVAPDGSVTQLATGWRRAALYKGYDHLETVVPGTLYDIPVHVYDQYYRVAKAHQLRLSVSSGDFSDAVPDANQGKQVTIATGRAGSFADLVLLGDEGTAGGADGDAAAQPQAAFDGTPAGAPSLGLPSTRRCASRRHFRIRLSRRLSSARVYVGHRRALVLGGRRLRAPVDLRGLPKGTVRVTVVGRTRSGRTVVARRRYHTCAARGRSTRRP
jgi:putative CocE/NonD family hydrolase